MFFSGFPSFSAVKSTARHGTLTQPELIHTSRTAPTPSKKPSRLQSVLRALRLSRLQPKVEEEQYHQSQVSHVPPVALQRIADLEFTISQLEQDNARQISDTNALFDKKLYPRMMGFAKERDDEKAARRHAEDRLAELIASHAKTEEVILKERERHRKAERARIEACFALEKKNANLQAALLDLEARTDLFNIEELQKSLVRLGIVDSDGQQYPPAYPVCSDCVAPFLKSVCAAAKRSTNSGEGREKEQKLELARAGHRAFEVSDDEDGCSGESELVSEEPARTLSQAPAPAQWFGSRSTRPRRFD
ncbi:hypothetical protein FRC05_008516 [Tulasnella sp. 425]|nr:hypothetical protein FRC05_008516 [Tulasnella sp. 425]